MGNVLQWIAVRKSKIPTNFSKFQLLTEYVLSDSQTVQIFTYRKQAFVEFWVIWDINEVIVSLAQFGQLTTESTAVLVEWAYHPDLIERIKEMFDKVLKAQYEYGSDILAQWITIGNCLFDDFQNNAILDFESEQRRKAFGNDDESTGVIGWQVQEITISFDGDDWLNITDPDETEEMIELDDIWESTLDDILGDDDVSS